MQTAVNVNADSEWDGIAQTIKKGLGKVQNEVEDVKKDKDELKEALVAKMGNEIPSKIRGGFFADDDAAAKETLFAQSIRGGFLADSALLLAVRKDG